nr:hypothetical protein [Tanacetum cinerariifolium]
MSNGRLVLVRDDGKPLRPKVDDLVNADKDNEVDEVFNETVSFMASTSSKVNKSSKNGSDVINKSLYATWKKIYNEDPYDDDDFDDYGLTCAQTKFANAFDISLHDLLTKPFDAGRFQYLVNGEYNVDFHPMVDFIEASPLRQYTRRARIAQSSALPPVADEPASSLRDDSQGDACPTDSGFIADQDMATIAKSSTLPHDSAPRVTFPAADKGSMQPTIIELTVLYTSLQRQHSELLAKFQAQEVEILRLKERVKLLEDKEGVAATRSRDAAPIKGRSIDEREAATKRVCDDTEKMATVLTSMDAVTVLTGEIDDVPTGSGSIPTAGPPAADIPTGSDMVPTASPVFATATVVTPYSRRNGKEVMVESGTPKKQKLQEQIDAQIMIDGLDRNNETIAKYLQEYQQFAAELPLERRIELISDLVKYQDNYAKTYKFQSQQRKPRTKKQKKDFYMALIRSNLGWKVKDFKGMTFEEIEAKFNTVWKQVKDFIPMGSKEEAERYKRKGIRFNKESTKKLKSSEEVIEEAKSTDEILEEKIKEMMKLIPIEEVYVEALQHRDREDLNQLWRLVKEILSNRPASSDKEMELWVELKSNCQRQRDFYASGEGLPSKEGSGHCDDKLQAVGIEFPLAIEVPTASEIYKDTFLQYLYCFSFYHTSEITQKGFIGLRVAPTKDDEEDEKQENI